jgi:16S rRNA G966 N2-methylase RsmD
VGIEALSQGAKEVIFVDNNRACAAKIRDNLSVIGLLRYDVIALDAMETIKRLSQEGKRFDIVFLDPPYYKGKALRPAVWRGWRSREEAGESLTKKTLQTISAYDILAPNGLVIAQHFKKETLPERLGVLVLFKRKIYGDTVLSFYKKHCSQGLSPQGTLRRQDKHWLGDK